MRRSWPRLILAALAAEALAIVILVLAVAIFGPKDPSAAQAYAQELGTWLGPLGGALVTLVIAYRITRNLRADQFQTGAILGLLVALVDAAILLASGTAFQWIFAASGVGRVISGALGGWLSATRGDS